MNRARHWWNGLSRRGKAITVAVVIVVLAALGAAGGRPTPEVATTTSPGPSQAVARPSDSPSPVLVSEAPSPTPPVPTARAPRTLVDVKGNGIKKSKRFTTSGDFEITYSFDCSSFGSKGNFQIYVDGDASDIAVNELAKKGSDTVPEYLDPGSYYLTMNSECSWHVVVKG